MRRTASSGFMPLLLIRRMFSDRRSGVSLSIDSTLSVFRVSLRRFNASASPRLNDSLQHGRNPVSWLNDYFKKNGIYVDNSFQRRSVWVERNKARLIETILTGFPMPEIYLWLGKADPKTGLTKYSIVDGQQRLTAIRDFIANGFSLRSLYLDRKNRSASYADKSFKELSDADKEKI